MFSKIFLASLAIASASAAALNTRSAAPGSLWLGEECADTIQCSGGAQCHASNVMAIKRCGGFNAACSSDAQCAYNSCQSGLCSGQKSGTQPQQPPIDALPGTLGIGALCSADEQCVNGAQCFASNVMRQRRCGGFNAACRIDAQCDGTTCKDGLCNGPPAPTITWTGRVTSTQLPTTTSSAWTGRNTNPSTSSSTTTTIITASNPISYTTLPTNTFSWTGRNTNGNNQPTPVPQPPANNGGNTQQPPSNGSGSGTGTSSGSGSIPGRNGTATATGTGGFLPRPNPPPFTGAGDKNAAGILAIAAAILAFSL